MQRYLTLRLAWRMTVTLPRFACPATNGSNGLESESFQPGTKYTQSKNCDEDDSQSYQDKLAQLPILNQQEEE
jgi:hypothetical protein